ncbi:cytochrome C biogenesis protein [Denitratisoma sp. DHT3]|uniref:urease accessory protein UreH domain-containing protein n=1 Tax=Denitratisoma sp. DHT3 TaxID=1981880 RepID=UPI001198C4E9|nr:sulfite exporter TauE/SafE family protein [Denitratisoma sp. DHT3]QDX81861.1 cytochrome C biogenesis protein [Denitratisoma sp. DHT3]
MPESAAPVGLLSIWLLGVSMGMTACTVTCLPFIGTWTLGRISGSAEAFTHTSAFLAGRIATYALLGALAGLAGQGLARALGGNLGNAAIGAASILAGLWLLWQPPQRDRRRIPPRDAPVRFHPRGARGFDALPPLLLGGALSLTPCAPLASLLALAAQSGTAAQGATYGLTFGLGAAVTPILVLVPLAGRLGRELRAGRFWITRWLNLGAAGVLIMLGLRRLWPLLG